MILRQYLWNTYEKRLLLFVILVISRFDFEGCIWVLIFANFLLLIIFEWYFSVKRVQPFGTVLYFNHRSVPFSIADIWNYETHVHLV